MALTSLVTSTAMSSLAPYAPLTTPFVYPTDCHTLWRTSSSGATMTNGTNVYVTFTLSLLYIDSYTLNQTSCQPSGWSAYGTSSLFHFSPAVCPLGWTAYDIHTSYSYREFTTGRCCKSGYTVTTSGLSPEVLCRRERAVEALDISTSTPYTVLGTVNTIYETWYTVRQYHTPFHVSWELANIASLSPAPPVPTCQGFRISSWDPASTTADISCPVAAPTVTSDLSPSDGLSTQNKVTIAVTVSAIAFMAVAALLFFRCKIAPRTDFEMQAMSRGRPITTGVGVERRASTENQDGDDELPKYADALRTAPVDPELQPPIYATPRPGTPNPEYSPPQTADNTQERPTVEDNRTNTTRRNDENV